MEDNFWLETGHPTDLDCPPSGTRVAARYENGDEVSIRFREVESARDFIERYPEDEALSATFADYVAKHPDDDLIPKLAGTADARGATFGGAAVRMMVSSFPVAVVEVNLKIAGTPVDLRPTGTPVRGENRVGAWIADSPLGYIVRVPNDHPWAGLSDFERSLREPS
jgi:hypothetical protein